MEIKGIINLEDVHLAQAMNYVQATNWKLVSLSILEPKASNLSEHITTKEAIMGNNLNQVNCLNLDWKNLWMASIIL